MLGVGLAQLVLNQALSKSQGGCKRTGCAATTLTQQLPGEPSSAFGIAGAVGLAQLSNQLRT